MSLTTHNVSSPLAHRVLSNMEIHHTHEQIKLPRVAITYCTQCKWMLRAAYYGQELLSTFGTTIGEIALIPATGGLFTVHLTHSSHVVDDGANPQIQQVLIWDRKAEGGFPETKILKQKIRNHIDPEKNLGHSDTPSSKVEPASNRDDRAHQSGQTHDAQHSSGGSAKKPENFLKTTANECSDCK